VKLNSDNPDYLRCHLGEYGQNAIREFRICMARGMFAFNQGKIKGALYQ